MLSRPPLYYCPPGVACPAHVRDRTPHQLVDGAGPDSLGGRVYGPASYDPATAAQWRLTRGGWYVLLAASHPNDFAALRMIPGEDVDGAIPGHVWHVPQLLRWNPKSRLVSAVAEIYRDYAWRVPAELEPIMLDLRAVLLYGDPDVPVIEDDQVLDLVIRILRVNYPALSADELSVDGWIDRGFVARVIDSAGGHTELERLIEAARVEVDGYVSG